MNTRREFLVTGLKGASLLAATSFVPAFLTRTAFATTPCTDAPILVVVQLSGGNDGLNTLIPFSDDLYFKARPSIGIDAASSLRLSDHLGLNPAMSAARAEFDAGRLAIVQNAGYPNPNRSHFKSMEIWHTARNDGSVANGKGWLGRYFDAECSGADPTDPDPGRIGISFGKVMPQAFRNDANVGLAINDPETFRWNASGETPALAAAQQEIFAKLNRPKAASSQPAMDGPGPALSDDFLRHTAMNATLAGDDLRRVLKAERTAASYPNSNLGNELQQISRLISGDFPTRVYYTGQGGYDTHDKQVGRHEQLLGDFSDSVSAFLADLRAQKISDRVVVLAFSEFGRRVAENGSGGTDHGAAAPLFIFGDAVRGGLHGSPPDLADLDNGDIKHSTDFRQIYASLLGTWLKTPAEPILGQTYAPLPII